MIAMHTHDDKTATVLTGVQRWRVPQPGCLRVLSGQMWLTCDHQAADHVLQAGEAVAVQRGQWLTLEPWQPASTVRWCWEPARRQPAGGGLRDRLWRGAALLAREAAAALLAWARSAEARASRAQGCISAGESMASAGALK